MLLLWGQIPGCPARNTYVPPPPPDVIVGTPEQREVTVYHYYTGNTQASDSVEIRARVAGYLDSIHFQDGSTVEQNQLLFVIDPRPYTALLDQAKAELDSRQATANQLESVYRRDEALLPSKAITSEQADIDRGNWLAAKASVVQAQATVRQAQLNLSYTEIHAPIGGRIGRRLVDVGNLISPDVTLLTTIMRYDPMYAYFNASEANYLAYLQRRREQMERSGNPPQPAAVESGLGNEAGYPHRGTIDFAESTVDPTTGTLLIRGVFPNPQPYYMAPGLFVRLRVPIGTTPKALLVPDEALGRDQAGPFLLVLNEKNVVARRGVRVGETVEGMRVIEEGLKPGERFIVEGLQRARPGIVVHPISPSSSASAPSAPSHPSSS